MIHKLNTISGKEFIVSSNESKRTFTIYINDSKYKTNQMSKEEFEENLYNTGKDWQNFLLTNQNYHLVK